MGYGHGKVILLGEHSVVYGRPALAKAIERACFVTAEPLLTHVTRLHIDPWNVAVDTEPQVNAGRELLQEALKAVRSLYKDNLEVTLHARLDIPAAAGMGSSAALGLAVLRALDEVRSISRSDEELFERSFVWERVFHGDPGGVDNAMATYGGFGIYTKGARLVRLSTLATNTIRLLAVDSGTRSGTREVVASVRAQYERERERLNFVFDEMAVLVERARGALACGDRRELGVLMTRNQRLLEELQLSTERLDRIIATALDAGALGAKITGAGRGGCVLALVDDSSHSAVKAALRPFGPVYEI